MGSLLRTFNEREYHVHNSHHDDLKGLPRNLPVAFSLKHHGVVHITHGFGQGADKQQQQHPNQQWIQHSWNRGVSLRPCQTTLTLRTLPPSITTGWRSRWTSPTSPPCLSSKSWRRWKRCERPPPTLHFSPISSPSAGSQWSRRLPPSPPLLPTLSQRRDPEALIWSPRHR